MHLPPSPPVLDLMEGRDAAHRGELEALGRIPLSAATLPEVLRRWSRVSEIHQEAASRLFVATTRDTADAGAEAAYAHFRAAVHPEIERLDQVVSLRILDLGLVPEGLAVPFRRLRVDASLFRPESQPLQTALAGLGVRYNQLTGARTVLWGGVETTASQLRSALQSPDPCQREEAWILQHERQAEDQGAIAALWAEALDLRQRLAASVGLPGYAAYRWQELHRFDYAPADCLRFHESIARVVVPAASRVLAWRKRALGLDRLRPWDLEVDPVGGDTLRPFQTPGELTARMAGLFTRLDPALGGHFRRLLDADLLDLDDRKHKAPIGYCIRLPDAGVPFVFANVIGVQKDLQTLAHEGGHAFHAFEAQALPHAIQRGVGAEFSEVASMAMELLAQDLHDDAEVGFYTAEEAARSRILHLENRVLLWPKVAQIDAFQHWAYAHPAEAVDPARCDAAWLSLSERFLPDVDWEGLEPWRRQGWQSITHIHNAPFYYVEYGMALLGAVQIWAHAQKDRPGAVASYRRALGLGGTASLPDLYEAAGARFRFGEADLREAMGTLMGALEGLWGEG